MSRKHSQSQTRQRFTKPRPGRKGDLAALLKGKGFVVSIVLTAALGVLIPRLIDDVGDAMGSPVASTLTEDNHDDYTTALVETFTDRDVDGAGTTDLRERVVRDGVKAGTQSVKLVLQGDGSHTVIVTDVRAHVLRKDPPVTGTFYAGSGEGVGKNVSVGVNLGASDLSVREMTSKGLGSRFFAGSSVTLKNDEPAVFEISTEASGRAMYTWDVQVDMVVDGAVRTETVTPTAGPLRLTSYADAYGAVVIGVSDPPKLVDPSAFCNNPTSICRQMK